MINKADVLKERDLTIDLIKGMGIILMVFRHARGPLSEYVLLFHMAIFFIASGYLYNGRNVSDVKSVFGFIRRKLKGLWCPYVTYTVVFILLHNLFVRINVYTDNKMFLSADNLENVHLFNRITLAEIIKRIFKAMFFRQSTEMGGGLWFLQVLLVVMILWVCIDFCLQMLIKREKYRLICHGGVAFVFLCIGYWCFCTDIFIGGYSRVFSVYWLVFVGMLLKKYSIMEKIFSKCNSAFVIIACLVLLVLAKQCGYIALDSNTIENPIFFVGVSMAGWNMMFGIARVLQRIHFRGNKFISYISMHSMSIVALHFLCFKLVSWIGIVIYGLDSYMLAAFPVLFYDGIWWLIYTVAGIAIPLMLKCVVNRIRSSVQAICNR